MYRILLADDEGIMLKSLESIIMGSFGEECEIACAKTGRAVVELAESFRPDIAFMDIQMPGLNGIQAMKEIRKTNQMILFVVITAYDKFDYAKEAINLGVLEYLTKPVNKKVVLDVLVTAMKTVDENRRKRSDDLKIREKLETVVPIVESGFLYSILLQDEYNMELEHYRELLDVREENGYMVVIEFGDDDNSGKITNAVGASMLADKFYPELRDIAKGFFNCFVGPLMGNRVVLYVPTEQRKLSYEERVRILEKTRNMIYKLEERITYDFRGGIGNTKPMADARASYKEALKALRESDSHVVHIKDVPLSGEYDGDYPEDIEYAYYDKVLKGDAAGTVAEATAFFDWMEENYGECLDDVRIKILEFVMRVEYQAFRQGDMNYGFRYRKNYLSQIISYTTMDELRRWFIEKSKAVCRSVVTTRETLSESVVTKAKHYIEENYQKDISLDDVSRQVDISPYYFSKLFKQEAGENFIEYLTRVRMHHAKEALHDKSNSVKEVCVMSGYSDPNYFSRIFKKYEGITPSEYRERLG